MPETASAALLRLTQEAVATCLCGLPTCDSCRREGEASTTLRYALPALADLAKAAEFIEGSGHHWQPIHSEGSDATCPACIAHVALAALRAVLGAKP